MGRFAYRFGMLLEFALILAICLAAVSAYRSRWRESDPFVAALGGLVVLAACVINEALMRLIPFSPCWWAIPYFPLRTVGFPFAAIMLAAFSLRRVLKGPDVDRRLAAAAGVAVGIAVVWFCWGYRDVLFLSPREHPLGTG